jgi:hypothetical protein
MIITSVQKNESRFFGVQRSLKAQSPFCKQQYFGYSLDQRVNGSVYVANRMGNNSHGIQILISCNGKILADSPLWFRSLTARSYLFMVSSGGTIMNNKIGNAKEVVEAHCEVRL